MGTLLKTNSHQCSHRSSFAFDEGQEVRAAALEVLVVEFGDLRVGHGLVERVHVQLPHEGAVLAVGGGGGVDVVVDDDVFVKVRYR